MAMRILFWLALAFAIVVIPPMLGLIGPIELLIIWAALIAVVVFAVRDIRRARST